MSVGLEHAREGIEHAEHAHVHEGDQSARWIAVLVAILAAALAISEIAEKTAMVEWLTHHISVSDTYAFYQAKNIRAVVLHNEQEVLLSLPGPRDPAVEKRIADARAEEARLREDTKSQGMKQLLQEAQRQTDERDHAEHMTHRLELVVAGLQIAIVLASVSVVTRVRWLAWSGLGLGIVMSLWGWLAWSGALL